MGLLCLVTPGMLCPQRLRPSLRPRIRNSPIPAPFAAGVYTHGDVCPGMAEANHGQEPEWGSPTSVRHEEGIMSTSVFKADTELRPSAECSRQQPYCPQAIPNTPILQTRVPR